MTVGKVIAVSSSQPRWIDMNGVQVRTSLVRDESPVPLHFGPNGPDGNELALHTETVYAFPIENYEYWGQQLGLDHRSWPSCFWGENLTVEGFSEEVVRIGDLLTFSGGAVLEVTGPRTPCTKMSWRLGLPGSILKRLTRDGLLGFYMRTITPGFIGKGERIALSSPFPDNMTVADVGRLLDRGADADPTLLRMALEMPRLSEQTVEQLIHTLDHIADLIRAKTGRWTGWRPFVVADIREETSDVKSFQLVPQDQGDLASYRAGQFLTVQVPARDGPVTRTWSLSEYSDSVTAYRLTVKRIADGTGSTWLHDVARSGTVVHIRPPAGQFVLERSGLRPVVLISAGIGITPMLAMLKAHASGYRPTPLTWMHSTKSSATEILRDEVQAVLGSNPLFTRQIHYTQPGPHDRLGDDFDIRGRLTREHLEALVTRPSRYTLINREIELNGRTREFFICGPESFEAGIRQALLSLGVMEHHIRSETFNLLAGEEGTIDVPDEATVVFDRSGRVLRWVAEDNQSLLETAEEAGLPIDFGCRSGTCGACESKLIEGDVGYPRKPGAEVKPGHILLCCARPRTPRIVVDA